MMSVQGIRFRKAQRCARVNYDVYEWRAHHNTNCRTLIPSFPSVPRMERLGPFPPPSRPSPFVVTKTLAIYDSGVPSEARVIKQSVTYVVVTRSVYIHEDRK